MVAFLAGATGHPRVVVWCRIRLLAGPLWQTRLPVRGMLGGTATHNLAIAATADEINDLALPEVLT
jgi:hypothetical protein